MNTTSTHPVQTREFRLLRVGAPGQRPFGVVPPALWFIRTGIPVGLFGTFVSVVTTASALPGDVTDASSAGGPLLIALGLILAAFGYYRQGADSR